jgi:hypothetical protein
MDEKDPFLRPVWVNFLSCLHDFLDGTLPSDKAIIKAMNGSDKPWDDMHHRSYFLRDLERIEQDNFQSTLSEIVGHSVVPLDMHDIYSKENMASIYSTVTVDISRTPGKVENVNIGADCSPEEILIYTELLIFFFEMYLLGHMKRCQGSTLILSNMRLELIWMLSLFGNVLELSTLERPLLLKQRWRSYLMLASSTQFP